MEQECKVVFLDRDGVINKRPPVHQYVSCREELIVLPKVDDAIRRLNESGLFVFVVSNQRGVNRGIMTLDTVRDIHSYLNSILAKSQAHIDDFYVCPHGNDECDCRKPKPGLLYQAEAELREKGYRIDKAHSCLIGDSDSDIEAGEAYGVTGIKIGNGQGEAADLMEAVNRYFEEIY